MQLTSVRIRNYRCIKDISIDLDQTTVLIGENNSGKTAFLHAIRACLDELRARSTRLFHEYDYHLPNRESSPVDSDPIVIELSFIEPEPDSWDGDLIGEITDIAAFDSSNRYRIVFRLTSAFDRETEEFSVEWAFLDAEGNELSGAARSAVQLAILQRMAPIFYLPALRDSSHFGTRGRFWRDFLSESGIPEGDRKRFERAFSELNDELISTHEPLNTVRSRLEDARKVMDFGPAGDAVAIDALPTKLFSLLSRTQVSLSAPSGAKIPVDRQGEGTQSLAVLLLFGAFLRSQQLDRLASPITALEEPEAHLHPSAIRSLAQVVRDLPGQKLVSSHSGDLLASVDIRSIRRFVRSDGDISVHRIRPDSLTHDETRKFDFHVRRSRGELLFARCWLLVEGETETVLFSGAAEALDYDIERKGVRCVEFSQTNVGMLIKVADQLGIEWYCVLDDDRAGRNYGRAVRAQHDGDASSRLITPYQNVERFLCDHGFGDIYVSGMSSQKPPPSAPEGTAEYWRQVLAALPRGYSKPRAALEAVLRMKAKETPVPELLRSILDSSVELARKRS